MTGRKYTKVAIFRRAIKRLKELQEWTDIEAAHLEADAVLCNALLELRCGSVVYEWDKIDKRYA